MFTPPGRPLSLKPQRGNIWRWSVLAVAALVCPAVRAEAGFISDGDFSSFSFDATGTATVAREPSGGNPGDGEFEDSVKDALKAAVAKK